MDNLVIAALPDPRTRPVEIVERKGLGHPDTICDALAEAFSAALSRFYRQRFGFVLHHNVDKVLLAGGKANPRFGGGEVVAPIDIFFAGRATKVFNGVDIPVEDIAVDAGRDWLRQHLPALDVDNDLRFHCAIHHGSGDLSELFQRQARAGRWLANDSSIGVGFAPFSPLEQAVLAIEQRINPVQGERPNRAFGEDVKVLGIRNGESIDVTLACALRASHVPDLDVYLACKGELERLAKEELRRIASTDAAVSVNAADDPAHGSVYLTVTGTSAEAGDDGEVGRGNRANGLITPHRPMTMEAAAGKNPVTHVGKLYNVAASRIAATLVRDVPGLCAAECYLVSRIGHPIDEPRLVEIRATLANGKSLEGVRPAIATIIRDHLAALPALVPQFLAGEISVY